MRTRPTSRRPLQAGAKGYLLKDSADNDLIRGIIDVAADRSFFSPTVAKVMLNDYVKQDPAGGRARDRRSFAQATGRR
jgi:DNA-binding NarL/FixJ family response regulator